MNCVELRKDIEKLRADFEAANNPDSETIYDDATLKSFYTNAKKIGFFEDRLLNKYYDDFIEKNLDVLPFGSPERIEGFENPILSAIQISDGIVLVGGKNGEARMLRRDEKGEWKFDGEKIKGGMGFGSNIKTVVRLSDDTIFVGSNNAAKILRRGEDGEWRFKLGSIAGGFFYGRINVALKLSDNTVVVGGQDGQLKILSLNDDGEWELDREDINGFKAEISTMVQLSDDMIFVGGGDFSNKSKILRRDADGKWKFDEGKVSGFRSSVQTAVKLSDDMVFVGGRNGEAKMLRRCNNEEWKFDEKNIDGFGNERYINTAIQLSDDTVLVDGEQDEEDSIIWSGGEVRILKRNSDGEWAFDEKPIVGFDKHINAMTKLSDDMILIGVEDFEGHSEIMTLRRDLSFDVLKNHLEDIAKKRGAET